MANNEEIIEASPNRNPVRHPSEAFAGPTYAATFFIFIIGAASIIHEKFFDDGSLETDTVMYKFYLFFNGAALISATSGIGIDAACFLLSYNYRLLHFSVKLRNCFLWPGMLAAVIACILYWWSAYSHKLGTIGYVLTLIGIVVCGGVYTLMTVFIVYELFSSREPSALNPLNHPSSRTTATPVAGGPTTTANPVAGGPTTTANPVAGDPLTASGSFHASNGGGSGGGGGGSGGGDLLTASDSFHARNGGGGGGGGGGSGGGEIVLQEGTQPPPQPQGITGDGGGGGGSQQMQGEGTNAPQKIGFLNCFYEKTTEERSQGNNQRRSFGVFNGISRRRNGVNSGHEITLVRDASESV